MWRFFTKGDDIYVQHDGMRKDLKTSLHKSGKGHHKWTEGGVERLQIDGGQYLLAWDEPEEFAPGGKNLLGMVIPSDHLQVPDGPEPPLEKQEKITLLAPAPDGQATYVNVVITPAETQLVTDQPSVILTSWPLPTRGTAWIVAMQGPWDGFRAAVPAALPQMEEKFARNFADKLSPGERKELRAVLMTDTNDAGVAQLIEVGIEAGMR